jgi:predicted amidohydrolase
MHGPTCIFWANLTTFSLQLGLIELAGTKGADVVVLPEEFLWDGQTAPPADCDMSPGQNCSIVNALGAIARKHSMYIVFGMRAPQPADDPYQAGPARGV